MIRLMLDSDNLLDLPAGIAPLLATYSDLLPTHAALNQLADRHPDSEVILIDRGLGDPLGLASVADVETGSLSVSRIREWHSRKTAQHIQDITVYCSRDWLPAVEGALSGLAWFKWLATLDGTCALPGFTPLRAPAAVQCFSAAMLGIHADGSLVLEDQWHR